ncbi:MAG TPA: ATP-binding cassette domain-containing protein [Bacteroidia bacterium]|nr:ATP-binding cassette domain-containing protein [Bacteroidia bacterium]
MSSSLPCVHLPEGLSIGYRRRFGGGSGTTSLATAGSTIELGDGRHLLLARNGRGKTTLLKTIAGIIPSLSGSIRCDGTVQFVDEDLRFDTELKPRQIFSALFKNGQRSFALEMAERIELDVEKPYGKLSKGNRQKVGLIVAEARAHHNGPQILLLDEPFSGLDFAAREKVDEIWRENTAGIVRLVCVHPDEPTLKADSALAIREGRLEQLPVNGTLDWMKTRLSLN